MADSSSSPSNNRSRRRRVIVKWVKRGLLGALALALIVGAVLAFLPEPIPAEMAVARRGPMEVTVNEDGMTRVKDRFVVSAPLTGNMPRLRWQPGDTVAAGEILVRIVPTSPSLLDTRSRGEAEARLAAAQAGKRQQQAQIARAEAALQQADEELKRQRALAQKGVIADAVAQDAAFQQRVRAQEVRSALFAAKVAEQEVSAARAALGFAGRAATDEPSLVLASPVDGQVLRVLRQDEGLVQAGTGILELGDPSSLEVVVDVLTRDAVHVEPGDRVRIHHWGGGDELEGRVRRVEPSAFTRISALGVEEQRVNVLIDFASPAETWSALGDGFRVETSIVTWQGDEVLTVPASAVFRYRGDWAVFAVQDGVARRTVIEVGQRNDSRVEVVKGLAEGARVIVHPSDRISHGADVVQR